MFRTPKAEPLYDHFPCPGCGRRDGAHPPLCPVAVRLTAADAQRAGGEWRARLIAGSLFLVEIFGCRWFPAARHLRSAAQDDPPADDDGEPLIYAPADELFRTEAAE